MGSVVDERKEFTVFVTGFGPFREQYPRNPSWEIASSLPDHLPPLRAKDSTTRSTRPIPEVRIIVHPEPVRVNWQVARKLVPQIWESETKYDVVIHIGMAGPQPQYQLESNGRRDGYTAKDVDGELLGDQDASGKHEKGWYWEGYPEKLETEVDVKDVLEKWKGHSPKDLDLRISNDAGRYLCNFIYYSSLSYLETRERPRKVVFLHVPAEANDETIPRGRELTLNLIRAIVESEMEKREAGTGNVEL